MSCRFVDPQISRLALSDGDWIEVKRDLTYGEQSAMFTAMLKGDTATLDPTKVTPARVLAYVVAWSFRDREDRPVAVAAGALDSLFPDTITELRDAIDAHEAVRARAGSSRPKKKKPRCIPTVSEPTSPSVA